MGVARFLLFWVGALPWYTPSHLPTSAVGSTFAQPSPMWLLALSAPSEDGCPLLVLLSPPGAVCKPGTLRRRAPWWPAEAASARDPASFPAFLLCFTPTFPRT